MYNSTSTGAIKANLYGTLAINQVVDVYSRF